MKLKILLLVSGLLAIPPQIIGQDFSISWVFNSNSKTSSLSVSNNFNYIAFRSYVPDNQGVVTNYINILSSSGQLLGKYTIDRKGWEYLHNVSVTNNGDIIATTELGWDTWVRKISTTGRTIWNTKVFDGFSAIDCISITQNAEYICLTGKNKVFLFNGSGSKIWEKAYGNDESAFFQEAEISDDGNLIIFVDPLISSSDQKGEGMIYAINSSGKVLWNRNCASRNNLKHFALNKSNKKIAIVVYNMTSNGVDITLLDMNGNVLKNKITSVYEKLNDVAITESGDICAVHKDFFSNGYQLLLQSFNSTKEGYDWKYNFEPPSGFHSGFSPEVKITNDGNTIIFSNGFDILCFKKEQLEKRWR